MTRKVLIKTFLAAAAVAASVGVAEAATPSCDQPSIVNAVTSRFAANARGFLDMDLSIADFGVIQESRFLPAGGTWLVERRYCHSTVTTDDGRKRALWYLIENNWGYAGTGSSVEFCVSGLDPWHVYGANCKSLR